MLVADAAPQCHPMTQSNPTDAHSPEARSTLSPLMQVKNEVQRGQQISPSSGISARVSWPQVSTLALVHWERITCSSWGSGTGLVVEWGIWDPLSLCPRTKGSKFSFLLLREEPVAAPQACQMGLDLGLGDPKSPWHWIPPTRWTWCIRGSAEAKTHTWNHPGSTCSGFPPEIIPVLKFVIQGMEQHAVIYLIKNTKNASRLSIIYFLNKKLHWDNLQNGTSLTAKIISVPDHEWQKKKAAKARRKRETLQTTQVCFCFILFHREVHTKTSST